MRFVWERKILIVLVVIVLFSAVMTVRQIQINSSRRAELREAFIFLHRTGHLTEAETVYARLLWNLKDAPTRDLVDDYQRTSLIAPTNQSSSSNILVRYHRTIERELEKRFTEEYLKAKELAGEKKD